MQYVILCSTNVDLENALVGLCHSFINIDIYLADLIIKYFITPGPRDSRNHKVTCEQSWNTFTWLVSKKGTPELRCQ